MNPAVAFLTTLLLAPLGALPAADTSSRLASEQPQVQANCNGVPIKRFGFCWVLGEAPNLLDDVPLQVGNTAPRVKVHPKDSSQIRRSPKPRPSARGAAASAPPKSFALKSADGPALALWLGGYAKDHCDGVAVDLRLKSSCRKAIVYDPMNGVSQELAITNTGGLSLLKGVLVRDWPLVIRLFDH